MSAETSAASALDNENAPFLTSKEHSTDPSENVPRDSRRTPSHKSLRRTMAHPLLIHGTIILIYTIIFSLILRFQSRPTLLPPSSIDGLDRQYSTTRFRNLTGNPYAGAPSDEIDAAWETLLAPMHIRVTEKELRRDNQDSVALPEGGEYLGWMGVFHDLHCVNMLRKWIYKDHYHANLTKEEQEHMFSHVDHCIDILRQISLCHADASLTTFVWEPAKQRPVFNASESIHTCIDWPKLMASMANRVVSAEEISRLKNPLMQANQTS